MMKFDTPSRKHVILNPQPAGVWKYQKPYYNISVAKSTSKSGKTFEQLKVEFFVSRDPSSYYTVYIYPLNGLTLITYGVFYLDPYESSNGVSLVMTTSLAAVAYMYVLNDEVPKTPYITWMSWFLILSVFMIFGSALEVIVVKVMCEQAQGEADHTARKAVTAMSKGRRGAAGMSTSMAGEAPDLEPLEPAAEEEKLPDDFPDYVPMNARKVRTRSRLWYMIFFVVLNVGMLTWAISSQRRPPGEEVEQATSKPAPANSSNATNKASYIGFFGQQHSSMI